MDKADDKSLYEIRQKIELLKFSFNKRYAKENQSEFSTSPSLSHHGDLSTNGDSSAPGNSSSVSKRVRPKSNCVETFSELPKQTIHGFVNEALFLKNFLLKKKESKAFKTLAVVGKFGVGKTTLCQVVFNDPYVKQVYLPRLWVSMYNSEENDDPKVAVLKRIVRSLGVEDEMFAHIKQDAKEEKRSEDEAKEEELSRLLDLLNSNLIGKKYLIVLDDVWEDNEWNQRLDDEKNQDGKPHLSRGFPKEFGGRVIVTTRDDRLAKNIVGEEENLLRLYPRTDAESVWKIYSEAVKEEMGKEVNPKYPGRFRQELMDKSYGIPLAALMLAKTNKMHETKSSL